MCNAIPILSPFFLYHSYIPPFEFEKLFYFLVSLPFLCMHAYIKSSEFRGDKGPVSKEISILPDNGNVGLRVCAKFHDHTYAVLYAHSSV